MGNSEEIRKKIHGKICPENTVYAAIYARVSTTNIGQKDSCDNQVAIAMNYIEQHPNISLRQVFVDDGISGKNDNRPEYQKMLKMIQSGEIQVVIIKDYSRTSRSLNAFELEEMLVENGVTFINLATGRIDDLEDSDAAFARRIQYLVNAKYTEDQSRKAHMTQQLRCTNKILTAKDSAFGYNWDKNTKIMSINEEQAEIIRWIYYEYVFHNATPASIYKMLKEKGIHMCERTITNRIKDERYIGKFYINIWESKLQTGKKKNKKIKHPKSEWVLIERPDLQIVDPAIFALAQRIHEARISVNAIPTKEAMQARYQGLHLFSNKIFCPDCGKAYHFDYADVKKMKPVYRIKSHSNCNNPKRHILEHDIKEITRQALKNTVDSQEQAFIELERTLTKCVMDSQSNTTEIQKLKKKRANYERKRTNITDFIGEGGLNEQQKDSLRKDLNTILENINSIDSLIQEYESSILDNSYVDEKLNSIRNAINELKNFTVIDRNRIINYIDRIELFSDDSIEISFRYGQLIKLKSLENPSNILLLDSGKMGKNDDPCSWPVAYRRTHRL
ncbi:MAG: recombinase family protein [Aeriscardovia sp.]|nr:recombinase family protein [Aeriscardovia sp.]